MYLKVKTFLSTHRFAEATIITTFTLLGSLFSAPFFLSFFSVNFLVFIVAAYLLIISIYSFNSWAGFTEDMHNPRLKLAESGVRQRHFTYTTGISLATALLLFLYTSLSALLLAVLVFMLWFFYSFPVKGFKYIPIAGTVLHIVAGTVQFQLGWLFFEPVSATSLITGLYFGIILSTGHINHELIDRTADAAAGIRSGAVVFGEQRWMAVHLVLAAIAVSLAAGMMQTGHQKFLPFAAASLIHLISAAFIFMLVKKEIRFFINRTLYRLLYAAAILAVLLVMVNNIPC